ncbi:hypothetical protein BJ508DRAFT_311193 [Ascobolus immersus RN42]|uniref:Uncharacterized protein n=1 Tax=Ascobolus immersus RN42 TaxID=1160509 RepID=A0A3N4HR13_ASCIM|nr:hypothetical protein BJ508DRAFT_311193 [Ascobolus immersus RN42]
MSSKPAPTKRTTRSASAALTDDEMQQRAAAVEAESQRIAEERLQPLPQLPEEPEPLSPSFGDESPQPPPPLATTAPIPAPLEPPLGGPPPPASSLAPTRPGFGGIILSDEQFERFLAAQMQAAVPPAPTAPTVGAPSGFPGELPEFVPTPEVSKVLARLAGVDGREVHAISRGTFKPYNLYRLVPDPMRQAFNNELPQTESRWVNGGVVTKQLGGSLMHYKDRIRFLRAWNLFLAVSEILFGASHPSLLLGMLTHTANLLTWEATGHDWLRVMQYHFLLHGNLTHRGHEALLDGANWAERNLPVMHDSIYSKASLDGESNPPPLGAFTPLHAHCLGL